MKRQRGFTLLELMVVVIIIAVLATLAFSAYNNQIRKSRRTEAKQILSDYALREEKFRSNNPNYGTLANINGAATTASGYYTIAVTTPSGTCPSTVAMSNLNSYTITATATGDQTKDTGCTSLVLENACSLTTTKTPTACW